MLLGSVKQHPNETSPEGVGPTARALSFPTKCHSRREDVPGAPWEPGGDSEQVHHVWVSTSSRLSIQLDLKTCVSFEGFLNFSLLP